MRNRSVLRLATANARNMVAQSLYLRFGVDLTRPVQTYGLITTRCNSKCVMCNYWREKPVEELPSAVWIRYLKQLREFAGTPSVNFSGGEPLVRRDLFDILDCCRDLGLPAGITTNGLLLNDQNARRLIDARVFSISVSIDSMDAGIHDGMRGVPGALARVRGHLDKFMHLKEECGSETRVILKPIVCAETMAGLCEIVEYAQATGMTGVSFQPIFEFSEESKGMADVDHSLLGEVVGRLIDMKSRDYPVLNSEASMRDWPDYFNGSLPRRRSQCAVPLRDLFILANGDAIFCGTCNSVIGNIAKDDIRTIWRSATARRVRRALVRCNRLCLNTCVVKRSLKDYVDLFRRFVR